MAEILDNPSRVLNGDESSFSLSRTPRKVVVSAGNKSVSFEETPNSMLNVTVMFTFAADGSVFPPGIVLPGKRVSPDIVQSVPTDWGLGTSGTGWMDTCNFVKYIRTVLLPALKKKRTKFPVIYFLDGHKTHTALEAADECNKLGIILMGRIPNASRILHPADVAIFWPLKSSWGDFVDAWRNTHDNMELTTVTFGPLLREAMELTFNEKTITSGFATCGLFPFNQDAVNYSKYLAESSENGLSDGVTETGDSRDPVMNSSYSGCSVYSKDAQPDKDETMNEVSSLESTPPAFIEVDVKVEQLSEMDPNVTENCSDCPDSDKLMYQESSHKGT
ncbi:uncharacterized protein LOC134290932 [Aedes albopictus]|uniref:DDE-1 domain-containing protein n=1 Tax=Aedes albopictus TaxID=7160 RepID=A0ABM1YQB6_AEDAL